MSLKPNGQMWPLAGPKSAAKIIVILFFALFGGVLLGSVAPAVLQWLHASISDRLKPPPTATDVPVVVSEPPRFDSPANMLPFALLGIILGAYVGMRFLMSLETVGLRWDKMETGDKVTFFVGTFLGLIASVPLLLMFQALDLPPLYRGLLIVGVELGFGALSVYALQTMSEILPWNRNRGPAKRSGIKLLDTNVIIDGRIYDVVKTGFVDGQLYVPGFVLEELQYIADSHDSLRRQRGRRGLDVLRLMQSDFVMEVATYDKLAADLNDGVDGRLLRLAKHLGADILTNDHNLRRVAELQDVRVMSLNDLALALRTNILPQEALELTIIREGNQYGQGIGYLDDGTMVVVENGRNHIGETVEVMVTQVHQTERGKMIFGEIEGEDVIRTDRRRPRPRTNP